MSSWLHSLFVCMTHRRRVTSPISERCKAEGQEARALRCKHRASFSFGSDKAISRAEHFIVLKEFTSKTPAHYHNASHKFIQRETIPEGRWDWGSYARYWRLRFACWRHYLFTVFLFPTPRRSLMGSLPPLCQYHRSVAIAIALTSLRSGLIN